MFLRNEKDWLGEKALTSIESFAVLANMLIIGGVGGYFIGYILRRIVKVLLIGLGIIVFLLASLTFFGTINVNYDGIVTEVANLFNPQQLSVMLQAVSSYLPMITGFALGFLLALGKR
jgi:uncharacterized membrane protein (Fun14 family)